MRRGNSECAAERRGRGSSGSVHRGNAGAARQGLCTGPCHPPAHTASARPQHLHGSARQLLESLSFTGSLREISGTKNSKNGKKYTIKSISFLNYVVFSFLPNTENEAGEVWGQERGPVSKEKQDEKPNRGSEKRDVRDLALRSLFQFLRSKCLDYIDFTIYGPSVAWQLSEIILVLAKKELFKVYMSASKSNPLKLFSQSLVSSPFSLLNICQQHCHFPFSFCKVHTGL